MKTDQPAPQPQRPKGKVFDVRPPGKAPASPISRPIIVGHQAQAARTQISVSGVGERGVGEQLLNSRQKIELKPATPAPEITPVEAVAPVAAPEPSPPPGTNQEPIEDKAKEKEIEEKDKPAPDPILAPEEPIDEASLAELAVEGPEAAEPLPPEPTVDSADEAPAQPQQPATPTPSQTTANPFTSEETEAATAHAAAMAMPADGAVVAEHGQKHILRTLLLILVLVAVVAFIFDILLDSGVVTLNTIPHTHFFGV